MIRSEAPVLREPKQERSRRSFERVQDAALALLVERGPDAFTLAEVCTRAEGPATTFPPPAAPTLGAPSIVLGTATTDTRGIAGQVSGHDIFRPTRIGVAFINSDGSMNVKLEAIPVSPI